MIFFIIIFGRYTNLWHKMCAKFRLFSIFKLLKSWDLFYSIQNDSENNGSSQECTSGAQVENSKCYR